MHSSVRFTFCTQSSKSALHLVDGCEGRTANHAQGLDNLGKWRAAMCESLHCSCLGAAQKLHEARVARQMCPQRQRVDEGAQHIVDLGHLAVCVRRAHHDVILLRVLMQQHLQATWM